MKRLSIKARVTFWYTLLVALIALLAAGALFWSAQRMMDNYYEEALVGTTQLALNDVRMEDGQLEIDRNLDDLPSVRVSLYTQAGDLIYGKWRFDLPFEENAIRPATERSGERWYVLDTRMSFPDAEDIWLRCYISADAAANLSDMSATLLMALLPALVVVAGVGGYFIARRAFRPVTRIARTAESIIDGKDLQKRIGLQGARDELYRLSKVFDDMLDRLEHSFERERRFTSDASHELRTPVAAILAQADFALSDIANEEDRAEALRDIRLRAGQMSTLIGRLLALTRMDAGQTRMELDRVDLADIAEVVAMQVEEGAAARGMTVECALDGPVWAMCDQTMLTQALLNLAERADALLIGCGLGRSYTVAEIVTTLIEKAPCQIVLDADGINAVCAHKDILQKAKMPVVLTPHAGEFARLSGIDNANPAELTLFARKYQCIVLYKGHRTLIAAPDGALYRNHSGNPGMAKGGSGDVLAGMLVSLCGQGIPAVHAACAAAWLHGRAGDLAANALSEYGMTPSDMLRLLPTLLKRYNTREW